MPMKAWLSNYYYAPFYRRAVGGGGSLKDFFFLRFFLLKLQWKVYNIQNSKTVFL